MSLFIGCVGLKNKNFKIGSFLGASFLSFSFLNFWNNYKMENTLRYANLQNIKKLNI